VVRFLEQVRGDGFAGVVHGETGSNSAIPDVTLLLSTACLDKSVGYAETRPTPQSCTDPSVSERGLEQHDENCRTAMVQGREGQPAHGNIIRSL
jgi:hypothetical protein